MKRRTKKRGVQLLKKGLSFRKNKLFFGFFGIAFSFIMLLGATGAWTSYTSWVDNHMQSVAKHLKVTIDEEFVDDSVLNLTDVTEDGIQKSVKVKNASAKDAILRVKFTESIAPFEIDVTAGEGKGNGHIKNYTFDPSLSEFSTNKLDTWVEGSQYKTGEKDVNHNDLFNQVSDKVLVRNLYQGETNRQNANSPEQLKIFKWVLNAEVYEDQIVAGTTSGTAPYWVFDTKTGWFYYSKVVAAGDTTAIDLLQKVLFQNTSLGNPYKSAFYDIQVYAEGVEPTEAGVTSFESNVDLLPMYQVDPAFQ